MSFAVHFSEEHQPVEPLWLRLWWWPVLKGCWSTHWMLWSLSLETQSAQLKKLRQRKIKVFLHGIWSDQQQERETELCHCKISFRECDSVILWDRVRLQLALAGVWVVQMAWLVWGICSGEAEKPRLATRGRLRQPSLCFNAWPHSTWRWKRATEAENERGHRSVSLQTGQSLLLQSRCGLCV